MLLLVHEGDELLAQNEGLEAYARTGATMGIPLQHPWANRLGGWAYEALGRAVDLRDAAAIVPSRSTGCPTGRCRAPGGPSRRTAAAAGSRRVRAGFEIAQVFAPADDDVVCFEPMTAPADALATGAFPLAPYTATFAVGIA